jgi:hypothetical protein
MMGEVLSALLSSVFGFFAQALPVDPFDGFFAASSGWSTGLAWLNWLFPVHDAVLFFTGWITATVSFAAGKRIVDGLLDVGTSIVKVV